MDLGLAGQVVVITGGAGGIGRATARAFAREGAKIVIADISDGADDDVPAAAQEIVQSGGEAIFVRTDVTSMSDVERLRDEALTAFGRLDVLINNAAKLPTSTTAPFFWDEDPEEWDGLIDVALKGTLNCSKIIGNHLREHGGGAIVNLSSDSARRGEQRETTYSAVKAAIIGFTKSAAIGLGPAGVRVNCISPGRTITERHDRYRAEIMAQGGDAAAAFEEREKRAVKLYPLRKFGRPDDVANVIVGLASPVMSGHVTGQVLSVSGGYYVG
ncbi:MAG: SDR family NAD(P)-dependent oxidoreductase [Nitriliruptoraceae bacterium]